jgi:hypothetical protein
MLPARCTYCGALAEKPSRLIWVFSDVAEEGARPCTLLLCEACSNSWCRQTRGRSAPATKVDVSSVVSDDGSRISL